jgi:integrase
MKKSLSACSVNKYIGYVHQVVASLKDGETGEPIHRRKWDSSVMDVPVVKQKEQRRPALKAKTVDQLVRDSKGDEQALYLIEGATGTRISEALALEKRHFINDCRTICIRQQVDRDTPRIVEYLKTDAAYREIDVSEEVSKYLRAFLENKAGLLFQTRNGTPYLHNNLRERWLSTRLKSMELDEPGMGWHALRRFRKTWLARKAVAQEDIKQLYWMGHKPKDDVRTVLPDVDEELALRLRGGGCLSAAGFEMPTAPKLLRNLRGSLALELELQEHCRIT